jgi:hypothetical protein
MNRVRRVIVLSALIAGISTVGATTASAEPLPSNCTRERGTVTCTTFEGPGNNQAGVGTTTTTETKGNTKNTNPEPQDLESGSTCNPPTSQGKPCNP